MTAQADELMGIFGFKRVESEMKTDRELLELAAKAAIRKGLKLECPDDDDGIYVSRSHGRSGYTWNPLTNDGDALRLACRLRLNIHVWDDGNDVSVAKTLPGGDNPADEMQEAWFAESSIGACIHAATRRAIVRAAAAIGEQMQ